MTNPLILTDYACVPPCKPCREIGRCETANSIIPPPAPLDGPFLPGDLDPTPLRCGCSVPWPVITLLGSGGKVWCSTHNGWQHVTKKETATAKRRLRNRKDATPKLPPF